MSFRLRLVSPQRPPETTAERPQVRLRAGGERVPSERWADSIDAHDIDGSWRGVIQAHGGLQGGTLRAPWWARS
ncbi:hypothetical protein [Variovorax sp. UMC13]|uniref:hypothetical protein n=1 Tax=Variovorax sp. UMC13 TaxID=1862326 RepID=UPI0015FFD56D|nr:hypothetical protein [Variovorax sp. UMC13]MBB1603599.1 hypothetical protein [Variovorax sp. UMC13]